MHILDAADTAFVLPYAQLVPAVAQAMRDVAAERIRAPERLVVPIDASSVLLCMPAIAEDLGVTKLITVHNDNARRGLPAIQGEVTVFDTSSGKRLALLDGPTVTARRTAAVTLLGIQHLALRTPKSVILIGTGVQAAAHADALIEHFHVEELRVCARELARAERFCEALAVDHADVKLRPLAMTELTTACLTADVVIALTTSRSPVIPEQLPPQVLAVGVGAFKPDMVELPAALLHARPIVVDHLAGAMHEAGDLLQAGVDWGRVRDLASVLDERPSQTASVLKTVGHAAWDLAAARVAVASL